VAALAFESQYVLAAVVREVHDGERRARNTRRHHRRLSRPSGTVVHTVSGLGKHCVSFIGIVTIGARVGNCRHGGSGMQKMIVVALLFANITAEAESIPLIGEHGTFAGREYVEI